MLYFLKLGGSLITFKDKPHAPQFNVIEQAINEIKEAITENPDLNLILAHGSGSFGHTPAHAYKTIDGVYSEAQWKGFCEVWKEAHDLNQIVMDKLFNSGIPAICFSPSAQVTTKNHKIVKWDTSQIRAAIKDHLVPVVYGDVVFDDKINGTILSTENLFAYLARLMRPERILLAGVDDGVFLDFPSNKNLLNILSPDEQRKNQPHLEKSASIDVTGGMESKVSIMMDLVKHNYVKSVSIFSGLKQGNILAALSGEYPGTTLSVNKRLV
jgi:isopentenyl phosphate kinase